MSVILDISGLALAELTAALAVGGPQAASLGKALDRLPVAAFSLGLNEAGGRPRDALVLASFLLAHTRSSRFVAGADPARQHPINLARNLSTLSALHGQRIAVGLWADAPTVAWFRPDAASPATPADYLRLLSSLWDSWPLQAMVGDSEAGVFVDAGQLVRIADPAYASIGGPLTLPTDQSAKPPLVLLGAGAADPAIDLHLLPSGAARFEGRGAVLLTGLQTLDALLAWSPPEGIEAKTVPGPIRQALGLGPSRKTATAGEAVFRDPLKAAQV
ncbi:LLM class flavin-dependent oxidoreductase [Xylophilus rhododendri]|uniref:LLM class flavin-dependent oxidoreductase n=1 Tax=Xylophilus rhododendri TaxID=2697032 RepID=A0A857JA96_9BURK|nr:LLM class flavin-dependent oxidoreductase [Xylophilus rhododendri]QHJ00915.1 LLM class flavin-dependent oxidoreductase [Xylophilus rhododendri]